MNGGSDECGGEGAERNAAEAEAWELLELCAVEKKWSIERLEARLAALGEGTWGRMRGSWSTGYAWRGGIM